LHVSPETTFTEAAIPHARNRILTIVLSVWLKESVLQEAKITYVLPTDKTSIVIGIVVFWWNKIIYNNLINDLLLCSVWERGLDASG
jgi:hypothetical protein